MKNTKAKFLAIAASAALVAMLGLVACGGGSSSASSASASSASASSAAASSAAASSAAASSEAASSEAASAEAASSEAASAEAASSEAAESAAAESTEAASAEASSAAPAASEKINVSSWTDAWMGVSDKGETFYYAESPDGSQGAMLVYDPNTNNYASFVGPTSNPQQGYVRIDDIQSGNALQFEVTAADKEGDVVIDLGEQGNAVLAKCEIAEVMKCFEAIDLYGNAVA